MVAVQHRIIDCVHIQVPALHDGGDLGDIGVGGQAQGVLPLIDLLGVVPVDHVGGVPVGVLLGETANAGVVVPGPQVVGSGLTVPVLPAVAEGVGVGGGGVLLVAEGVASSMGRSNG